MGTKRYIFAAQMRCKLVTTVEAETPEEAVRLYKPEMHNMANVIYEAFRPTDSSASGFDPTVTHVTVVGVFGDQNEAHQLRVALGPDVNADLFTVEHRHDQ